MLEKIRRSDTFKESLLEILIYIAKNRANNFKNTLKKELEDLTFMPYKYRQSIYFNQKNIRDFIFKGYCIPYV
ncbi:MAG: type II toxin-antitoxin system RelE/ParE family toxin, partial [Sulfurimonas sp.]|nr:type II toxin-antitoxin system RelE/ParE family toxin [Sulfurimonas sp.]